MLKQLFDVLRSGESLDRAFADFQSMLEHAEWMFRQANRVLRRESDAEEVRDALYSRDGSINQLLKDIRNATLRHLTVHPGSEVAGCLALVSIAKDAERIGDYCKNVFEVGRFYTEDFHVSRYHEPLREIESTVESLFGAVRTAWRESNTDGAKQAIRDADVIRKQCDDVIEQLLVDRDSIQMHEAVAYSLLARHYKRVASHLANVATSVMGRIEDLDFRRN